MRSICPECQGEPIKEILEGFTICGFCKGNRTVEAVDESYHVEHNTFFRRGWLDVSRLRGIEEKRSQGLEKDFNILEKHSGKKWIGYRPFYKTLVHNEVHGGN